MLEGVTAGDEVRRNRGVFLAVEFIQERHVVGGDPGEAFVDGRRVDTDAANAPELGHASQERALAAADLDDRFPEEIVIDQKLFDQLVFEGREGRRERLSFFVRRIVAQTLQIEGGIGDVSAGAAYGDAQIAARERPSGFAGLHHEAAVHRNIIDAVKELERLAPAPRAKPVNRSQFLRPLVRSEVRESES